MAKTHIPNPKAIATIETVKGMYTIVIRGRVPVSEMMYNGYMKASGFMWTPACSSQLERLLKTMNSLSIGATNETFAQICNLMNR